VTYTSVDNSQGFWGMTASGWGTDGEQQSRSNIDGIADTGTTLLLLDDSIVSAYYQNVQGASYDSNQAGWLVPTGASLPSFELYVSSTPISVPGTYLCYKDLGDGTCYGGIQSSSGIGQNIFGDIVLKAAYVVFDFGNTQIGWAGKS
jgi:Eukaryotic aspartyl protease